VIGGNDLDDAIARLRLGRVGAVLGGAGGWIVGGVARALVAGTEPDADVDIAVDADLDPLLEQLGLTALRHDRFGTAVVPLGDDRHADIARTRSERYRAPGALPEVEPAPIEDDLGRRDFSVNAIAVAIAAPHDVLDPFDGTGDLGSGRLRVLHADSFRDDPTRAIRAARYCSRLGLEPEPETLALLAKADLALVSEDRRDAELRRLAAEPQAATGFALLDAWGVRSLPEDGASLLAAIAEKGVEAPWSEADGLVDANLIVAGSGPGLARARDLAAARPSRPSQAVRLATGVDPAVLLVAAATGGAWVDRYLREWRDVRLEISGDDLLAAGIPRGPAIGAGLGGALERKLDGELDGGREAELAAALEIARDAV
jgi:tRNA nucleotidyltransferase (CCA-adding enzyme)